LRFYVDSGFKIQIQDSGFRFRIQIQDSDSGLNIESEW